MPAYDTQAPSSEKTRKSDPASRIGKTTRVVAGDDRTVYDNFAVFLHWLTVLLVPSQFALAETWE